MVGGEIMKRDRDRCGGCLYAQQAQQKTFFGGVIFGEELYECYHDEEIHRKYDRCARQTPGGGTHIARRYRPLIVIGVPEVRT